MLDTIKMTHLTADVESKSEKMRVLSRAGYSRSEIAKFLDVRYQFVRNVLVREEARNAGPPARHQPAARDISSAAAHRVIVGSQGEVLLPDKVRQELGLRSGETLLVSVEDDEIRLTTVSAAIRKVQAAVRQYVPDSVSLVDELLDDRRREIESESKE